VEEKIEREPARKRPLKQVMATAFPQIDIIGAMILSGG